MSGPVGADVVRRLLEERRLQSVPADRAAAEALLKAAARHLDSALVVADSDPDGAYTMLYDAARKSLAALLQVQGLRATSRGGHVAVQLAVEAQFPDPPPRTAFRPFGRLRTTRNRVEYDPVSPVDGDDVRTDHTAASRMHAMAASLLPEMSPFPA